MKQPTPAKKIFSLISSETPTFPQKILKAMTRPVEYFFGLSGCEDIYQRLAHVKDPHRFMQQCLEVMNVRIDFDPQDKAKIPPKGPCVVVSNHPFGAIEGIILADLLLSVRPDVKIVANFLLNRIPPLRPLLIGVDPFERADSAKSNVGPLRAAMRWVKQGGMLLVFPAGEVSHYRISRREVADPLWNNTVARIVRHAQAAVVPIFLRGRNSTLFHAAGMVHPRLRTVLLPREMLKKKGKCIRLKIGNPISYRWLRRYNDERRLMEYLRWRTYIMGHPRKRSLRIPAVASMAATHRQKPVAGAQDPQVLRRELEQLPAGQLLVQSGPFCVWYARAPQIPHVLLELGRLREITFRLANEGSGKPLDLDRFDRYYLHLFIWNEASEEIVGAYRLGQTDAILAEIGRKGLYTSTLFHSRMDFFKRLGPSLEMGRSFIRPEYQKSYSSLLLLWRGIGAFVTRHPQYRMLFGPVSISRDYSDLSRRLMATTLLRNSQASELALMVRPKKPARLKPIRICGCDRTTHDVQLEDFKEVCAVVSDIEIQQKDVPVLLRQYLNLGGQLLSFNIDKLFSNVMDGLIVVDLLRTDRKTLTRYLGAEGAAAFLEYQYRQSPKLRGSALETMA
ncbi:MAG: lysophospholipid acyltransferase family protein [Desulfatitalea sp.]|nr:lysophospholipid acyltransferase family protein [Desulfatitalea sp.]NNK00315.1 lysophospholipid acyltransferase family protein [Desulfatitalea sp.]